jgi:hypothetical protein
MGIDRVLRDQKEKIKQNIQYQNTIEKSTCKHHTLPNPPFDEKSRNTPQDLRVIEEKKNTTIATRNPNHHKKIESVKSMFNLK